MSGSEVLGAGGMLSLTNGSGVSFRSDENLLDPDNDDDCIIL